MSLDRLLVVTAAVRREAIRRDAGERHDPVFDTPIAMLLDLADDLAEPEFPAADLLIGACTNNAACEADSHLFSCPVRR